MTYTVISLELKGQEEMTKFPVLQKSVEILCSFQWHIILPFFRSVLKILQRKDRRAHTKLDWMKWGEDKEQHWRIEEWSRNYACFVSMKRIYEMQMQLQIWNSVLEIHYLKVTVVVQNSLRIDQQYHTHVTCSCVFSYCYLHISNFFL